MTASAMPRIRVEGQEWLLCNRFDMRSCIPKSSELGFATTMRDTSNWEGRIDTFQVVDGALFLVEIEVNLDEDCLDFIPENGMREDITHHYWAGVHRVGQRYGETELCQNKSTILRYRNLLVSYTGTLIAGRNLDRELLFNGGIQPANRFKNRIVMEFTQGILNENTIRFETGSSYDDGRPRLDWS